MSSGFESSINVFEIVNIGFMSIFRVSLIAFEIWKVETEFTCPIFVNSGAKGLGSVGLNNRSLKKFKAVLAV